MIDDLLKNGWSYHTNEAARLAGELEEIDLNLVTQEQVSAILLLSNHTMGEHLAQWKRARIFAEKLVHEKSTSAENWALLFVTRFMDADMPAATLAEQFSVKFDAKQPSAASLYCKLLVAKAMLINQQFEQGLPIFSTIIESTKGANLTDDFIRKLAIACHSIANHLLPIKSPTDLQNKTLFMAAQAALDFWQICGTWQNVERGLYLVQIIQNKTANYQSASLTGQKALNIIADNGDEPVDEAFIRLELAKTYKAQGESQLQNNQITIADKLAKQWDDTELYNWYIEEKSKV